MQGAPAMSSLSPSAARSAAAPGRARSLHFARLVRPHVAFLTLLAAPAAARSAEPLELVAAVERISLPPARGPLSIHVDALGSSVTIEAPADAPAIARGLRAIPRSLCPRLETAPGEVILRCRTRRLDASLVGRAGAPALQVRELLALPWSGEAAPPFVPLDAGALGLGGPCPGDRPAVRGECALAAGRNEEAGTWFRQAAGGEEARFAALRLGDLALAAGDPAGAAGRWRAVGADGGLGRVAATRLCELDAACLDSPLGDIAFRSGEWPQALRADMLLRAARRLAFAGRPLEAARALAPEQGPEGACARAQPFCRGILVSALSGEASEGAEALSLYLELSLRDRGPLCVELATAAAARAEALGAPEFAAGLLGAVVGHVGAERLAGHLLRTAELYLAGGDRARADVVAEFARVRLGPKALAGTRWARLRRTLVSRPGARARMASALRPAPADDEASIAQALGTVARARARSVEQGGLP